MDIKDKLQEYSERVSNNIDNIEELRKIVKELKSPEGRMITGEMGIEFMYAMVPHEIMRQVHNENE